MKITKNVKNTNVVKEEGMKLKVSEKIATAMISGIGTLHSQVIQMFLLFFYTDMIGISTRYITALFLITRILDAFIVPVFGIFIDKVMIPWGKYKPWLVGIEVLIGISGWFTFTSFNLNTSEKYIYATVTYMIYSLFLAMKQVPGTAIRPAITKSIDDRISMNQIGYFFVMIATVFVTVGVQPLYKDFGGGNDAKGLSLIMAAVAVFTIIIAAFQGLVIEERYIVTANEAEKKHLLKEMLIAVFTNKTAIIVYIYMLAVNLANGIKSAITIYYFKYYFHNESLLFIVGLIGLLTGFLGIALSSKVTKLIGIKINLLISTIISVITMSTIMLIPATQAGIIMYITLLGVGSFFTGLSTPAQGTMMPAAMDYIEWKYRMNINGFMGSFQGVIQTIASALAGSISTAVLTIIGYEQGVEQSGTTIYGIKLLMSIIPAFITLLTISVVWFDLTEDKQVEIAKELAKRRKNNRTM